MTGIEHRPGHGSRLRGLALSTAGLVVLGLLAARLAGIAWQGWASMGAPGLTAPDGAVATLAATAGLALLVWLGLAVFLSVASAIAGRRSAAGRAVDRVTRRLAPLVVRNAVAAALGVVVVAAPMTAQAASTPVPASIAQQGDGQLSPAWLPTAPVGHRAGTGDAATDPAVAARSVPSDLGVSAVADDFRPGWIPTRPLSAPGARARPTAPVVATPRRSGGPDEDVVVRRGDTLWSIAARHLGPGATDAEIALDWPHWFTANRAVVGHDPDRLHPGQRLRPPSAAKPGRHSANPGTGTTGSTEPGGAAR